MSKQLSEQEIENKISEMSELKEKALDIIKKYNELSSEINFNNRVGLIVSEYNDNDEDDDDFIKPNYDDAVNNGYDGDTWSNILSPGASDAWFPSGMNC